MTNQPPWHEVLQALRAARGVTQEGWAARLGVSLRTVQRWERGERVPDPGAEAGILAYCAEKGPFRPFEHGPLARFTLSVESLRDLLAEARQSGYRGPVSLSHAAPAPLSNLPAPLTSFVGRVHEIAAIRRAQAGARLLTLTGAGGCGKTRLALEVARELLWAYPHGIWFVDLAPIADSSLVPQTVAASLGVRTKGRSITDALLDHLRARNTLLILDNCEHLVVACAWLIAELMSVCPSLEVLATSREALGVDGETLWRVPPLSLPGASVAAEDADAVRLFIERARRCRPDFRLTPENEGAVVEVCRQLDGIPLAIELAAARLTVLSVHGIAERLHDRFRLLTSGSRSALPRHQTLRATLDWSWDLLSPPAHAVLRRMSVFAGGCSLKAAEALCAGDDVHPGAVLDLLAYLVDRSLVVAEEQDGTVRYQLLESVRQYAAERLDEIEETASAHDRHLEWYLELAEAVDAKLRGPQEPAWLAELDREHENMRAALVWSVAQENAEAALRLASALARYWELYGYLGEGRQWLARALETPGEGSAALRARALHDAGALAYTQGDYAAARQLHRNSLELHRTIGTMHGIAAAQGYLGRAALRQGDYAEARAFLDASLTLHTELGHGPGIASVRYTLGLLALHLGDYRAARMHLDSSLALQRRLGNKDAIASALEQLATVAGEEGDIRRQAALLEECLALYRELGARQGIADAQSSLAMVAWAQGDYERAAILLEESLALSRAVGDRRGIARILANSALVALYQGDAARAAALGCQSLTLYREAGDAWAIGRYLPVVAGAALASGQPERAARLFAAAAGLREHLGTSLPPVVQSAHDRALSSIRASLGDSTFRSMWADGRTMTPDEAVALALGDGGAAESDAAVDRVPGTQRS